MKLPAYKLVDDALRHGESACHGRAPANFRWQWLDEKDGFHFPDEPVFFTDRSLHKAKFYSAGRKIAWLLEPKAVQEELYQWIEEHADEFDVVLTFDRTLIRSNPEKFRFFPFGGCWISDKQIKAHPKTKRCSIIASAKSVTEGQKLRHEVIERLSGRVDVFGRGYQPVDEKIEALRDYEFTIVIENCRQDDYFSEKLIDSLASGTVPLYWGTSKISEYFPTGIHPFSQVDELEKLLERARPDKKAIRENLSRIQDYLVPEDWIWENCKDLFSGPTEKVEPVAKLSDFLDGGGRHRKKVVELEQAKNETKIARDKARAERERYRAERDEARRERNTARAERDQALARIAEIERKMT